MERGETAAGEATAPGEPQAPATPENLFARFRDLGIEAVTHDHPPLHTVEESRALRGELPGGHCKNLFLKDRKGRLWLVVTLEDALVDMKRLHERIGAARLSFGNADLLWEVLGVRPGAVTPFGLINDRSQRVTVVLDREMMACDLLNYHPLVNDRTTALRAADLVRFIESCGHTPQILDVTGAMTGAPPPAG